LNVPISMPFAVGDSQQKPPKLRPRLSWSLLALTLEAWEYSLPN
jgi:hypothetical protein